MNIFVIELLVLAILILILMTLFADEKRLKTAKSPTGKMTGYWDGPERRESVRIDIVLSIRYSIDKTPNQSRNSVTKNVSTGGILMQVEEKFTTPTLLILDIVLPNGEKPIAGKGEAVWVKELSDMDQRGKRLFDAGIKFTSMSSGDKERLNKHITGCCS